MLAGIIIFLIIIVNLFYWITVESAESNGHHHSPNKEYYYTERVRLYSYIILGGNGIIDIYGKDGTRLYSHSQSVTYDQDVFWNNKTVLFEDHRTMKSASFEMPTTAGFGE